MKMDLDTYVDDYSTALNYSNDVHLNPKSSTNTLPVDRVGFAYSSNSKKMGKLFDQNLGPYILQIQLHYNATPLQRQERTQKLERSIKVLGQNSVTIITSEDNRKENRNPATVLVNSPDVLVLMQKLQSRPEILGPDANQALEDLKQNHWPEFSAAQKRQLV